MMPPADGRPSTRGTNVVLADPILATVGTTVEALAVDPAGGG
jgi:uracil phosphoribosyltransferase